MVLNDSQPWFTRKEKNRRNVTLKVFWIIWLKQQDKLVALQIEKNQGKLRGLGSIHNTMADDLSCWLMWRVSRVLPSMAHYWSLSCHIDEDDSREKKTVLQVVAGESIDLTMQLRRGQRPFTIKCIENLLNYTVVQAILLRATSACCLHNLFIFQAERGNIAV